MKLFLFALIFAFGGYLWEVITGEYNACFGGFLLIALAFVLVGLHELMLTPEQRTRRDEERREREAAEREREAAERRERERAEEKFKLAVEREQRRRETLSHMHLLSGEEFEEMVARVFSRLGYATQRTRISNDGGVDIIMHKGPRRVLVQCKRHQKPVGVKVVRELLGVVASEGADKGIVVTNNVFTSQAETFAHGSGRIELLDGASLARIVSESRSVGTARAPGKTAPPQSGHTGQAAPKGSTPSVATPPSTSLPRVSASQPPKGLAEWNRLIDDFAKGRSPSKRLKFEGIKSHVARERLEAAAKRRGNGAVRVEHLGYCEYQLLRVRDTESQAGKSMESTRSSATGQADGKNKAGAKQPGGTAAPCELSEGDLVVREVYRIAKVASRGKRSGGVRTSPIIGRLSYAEVETLLSNSRPPEGYESVSWAEIRDVLRRIRRHKRSG